MQKQSIDIRDEFHFSVVHRSINAMDPVQSSGVIYFAQDLLRSYFKWNLFLKYLHCHRLSFKIRWIYYRLTVFMHWWTSIYHMTLSLSAVKDKQKSSLVAETFDWRHIMATAVKRYGWMRRLATIFRRVVCKLYTKSSKIMHRTVVKMKTWKLNFIVRCIEVWKQWVPCKVNMTYFRRHLLCTGPIAFLLRWTYEPKKNEIYFLIKLRYRACI